MARTIIYNADGSVASVTDSTANQGAAGPIAATTLGSSGDSNLSGNLTVAGSTALNGTTSTKNLNVAGTLGVAGVLTAASIKLPSGGTFTFPDGTTQSTAATGNGSSSNSNGATGAINASSISNSGDTNLTGALIVAGTTALNGATNVKALTAGGKAIFQDTSAFTGLATFQSLQATNIIATNNATLQKVTFGDGTTQSTATLKGDQGIQGVKGDTGAASTVAGPKGDQGIQGIQGIQGVKGDKGDQGPQGIPGTSSSGTAGPAFRYTTGGPPSTSNPATQNDGDTAFDPTNVAIYGPRVNGSFPTQPFNLLGPTGPQGIQGPKGDTGAAGSSNNRSYIFAGSVWATAAVANTQYYLMDAVISQTGGTTGLTPIVMPMIRSGSVTGFTFNQVGPVSGTYSITLYKNNVAVTTFTTTGTGIKAIFQSVTAGTLNFAAGDVLSLSVATSGSGNLQGMANLEIQTA